MLPLENFKYSIVRILSADGSTKGTGFVVTTDGKVATCAHVISSLGQSVQVVSLATGNKFSYFVEEAYFRSPQHEDVAILSPSDNSSPKFTPLQLGSLDLTVGDTFVTFGFPKSKSEEGAVGKCEIIGKTTENGFPVFQLRSSEITQGFSGAPIWDARLGIVIGMVVSVTRADDLGRMSETSFVIPIETLRSVCHELKLPDTCPYRSLEAFDVDQLDYYFGRDKDIQELATKLQKHNLVCVVGVSGSGKSSLVRAGLMKAMMTWSIPGSIGVSRCLFAPSSSPILNLLVALVSHQIVIPDQLAYTLDLPSGTFSQNIENILQISHQLGRCSPSRLAEAIHSSSRVKNEVVLIADQFERLYTECQDEVERTRYIDLLLSLANNHMTENLRILIALRADFYSQALAHSGLAEKILISQMTLLHMKPDDLRQVIVEPARLLMRSFQPELVDKLISDVQGRTGDLPLLEFALTQLWSLDAEKGILTLDSYEKLGYEAPNGEFFPGVQGAIARVAENLWHTFDEQDQQIVRRIFLGLIVAGSFEDTEENITKDASRRGWLIEWDESAKQIISRLIDARLLTTNIDKIANQPTIEVAHEALIRSWSRLQKWVNDYRPFIHWYNNELAPYLRNWIMNDKVNSFLLPKPMIKPALEKFAQYPEAFSKQLVDYIQKSKKRVDQIRRTTIISALTLACIVLFTLIWIEMLSERRFIAEIGAKREQNIAIAANAQQVSLKDNNNDLALALTLETIKFSQEPTLIQRLIAQIDNYDRTPELIEPLWRQIIEAYAIPETPKLIENIFAQAALAPGTRKIFNGHTSGINQVAFSSDGTTILSASSDGSLILWDKSRNQELQRFVGHSSAVYSASFSHDGKLIASGACDQTIRIWDVHTGKEINRLLGHSGCVKGLAFSRDDTRLLSGSSDGTLRLWETASGQTIRSFSGHSRSVNSIALSSNDRTILSGSADTLVLVWDIECPKPIYVLRGHNDIVLTVAISPDGLTAFSSGQDFVIRQWDLPKEAETCPSSPSLIQNHRQYWGHTGGVSTISVSADGHLIASGGDDNVIRLWDIQSGAEIRRLGGHMGRVLSIAFSPDRHNIVSSSEDKSIRLWDITHGAEILRLREGNDDVLGVAIDPKGELAISGEEYSEDHSNVNLWDLHTGEKIQALEGVETSDVWAVAFSPNGKQVLAGSSQGILYLWEIGAESKAARKFDESEKHSGNIWSVAVSPNGKTALSGSSDLTVKLWNVEKGTKIHEFVNFKGMVWDVAYSPNGQLAVVGSADGVATIFNLENYKQVCTFKKHDSTVYTVAFTPDNSRVLSGSNDGTMRLWDATTCEEIRRFDGHTAGILSLAVSYDGQTAVSGSIDTTLRLWNLNTGEEIRRFDGHFHLIRSVAMSSDNQYILSGGDDGTLRLWRIIPFSELLEWTDKNRYVRHLSCFERDRFNIQPLCTNPEEKRAEFIPPISSPISITENMSQTIKLEPIPPLPFEITKMVTKTRSLSLQNGHLSQIHKVVIDLTGRSNMADAEMFDVDHKDFVANANVEWGQGVLDDLCGFIFRYGSSQNTTDGSIDGYYAILIDRNGNLLFYGLAKGEQLNPEFIKSSLIKRNARDKNQLSLIVVGDTFKVFINGQLGGEFKENTNHRGDVGLFAITSDRSERASCSFTDAWVWSPAR